MVTMRAVCHLLFISVFCTLLLREASSGFVLVIEGCSLFSVNGLYVCESSSTCHNVNEKWRLFKLYKMFDGVVRGKWYISRHNASDTDYVYSRLPPKTEYDEIDEHDSDSGVAMYGWKYADRENMRSIEQTEMFITRYPLQCAIKDSSLVVPIATFENVSLLREASSEDHFKLSLWTLVHSMTMRVDNKDEVSSELKVTLRQCIASLLTHIRLSFSQQQEGLFIGPSSQTNVSLISKTVDVLDIIEQERKGKVSHLLPVCVWLRWEGAWSMAERCYRTILQHFDIEQYVKDHKEDEKYGTKAIRASQSQSTVHCFTHDYSSDNRKNQIDLCILLHELVKYSTWLVSNNMDVKESLSVVRKIVQYDYDWWISKDNDDYKEFGMSRFVQQLVGLDSLCCFLLYGNARKGADRSSGAEKMGTQKDTLTSLQLQSIVSTTIENVQKASLYGLSGNYIYNDAVTEMMQMVRSHLFSSSSQTCFVGWGYCLSSDQAQSLLLSLMLQGNIEVAASHVSSFTMAFIEEILYDQALAHSASQNEDIFKEYQSLLSSFGELYDNTNNGRNSLEKVVEDMKVYNPRIQRLLSRMLTTERETLSSVLVRHTMALHQIFYTITDMEKKLMSLAGKVEKNGDRREEQSKAFAIFLTTFLQLAAPTVLTQVQNNEHSAVEPLVLRLLMVDMLELLNAHVRSSNHLLYQYIVTDPVLQIGSKSLFLLAYQGIQSQVMNSNTDIIHKYTSLWGDAVVPALYRAYIQRSHPFWPWSFTPSQENGHYGNDSLSILRNDKSVKVAFVSSFFKEHSVGRLFSKIVIKLHTEASDLDVHMVSLASFALSSSTSKDDDIRSYVRESISASHYHHYSGDVPTVVNALRALHLDVVVFTDNFMDSSTAHMMMFRVAPLAITCWGHPYTTGYRDSIDYFITSTHYEPHGLNSDAYKNRMSNFAEQLIVFDSLNFQFFDTRDTSSGDRQELYHVVTTIGTDLYTLPSLLEGVQGYRFYTILQSLMKMHPSFDNVIAQLLIQDPMAIVLLSWNPYQLNWNAHWKRRMIHTLREHLAVYNDDHYNGSGIRKLQELAHRVVFLPKMSHKEYKNIVCSSSISLDPFPFGGGVTMIDALSCSTTVVPFVTTTSLHSVHALAHGMLSYMHQNTSMSNSILCQQVCDSSKDGKKEFDCTCLEAKGVLRGISVAANALDTYTAVAIRTAEVADLQRSRIERESHHDEINEMIEGLYHDDAVVKEWRTLLKRL